MEEVKKQKVESIFEDKTKPGPYDNQYVVLKNINKVYDNHFHAVHDFNLTIKKNEFVVFVGPSGCGKSTTLRMIAGLEDISTGELYINGEYSNDLLSKDRDIAMVFQNYALYPNMSIFDNMAFALKIRKFYLPVFSIDKTDPKYITETKEFTEQFNVETNSVVNEMVLNKKPKEQIKDYKRRRKISLVSELAKIDDKYKKSVMTYDKALVKELKKQLALANKNKDAGQVETLTKSLNDLTTNLNCPKYAVRRLTRREISTKVCDTAKILEIEDQLNKKPKELSGGQRQRVALGRAIVRNARIFLMDEPLSNLDAKLRVQMRSEIIQLHKKIKATTIYVTHDQTEAMTMADRIVVMKSGYVQQIGTPIEIYRNPANLFVASFIGSPAMNLIKGTYSKGEVVFPDGSKYKLPAELAKRHDEFYRAKYAEETRLLPEYEEKLNKEKEEFFKKRHKAKDVEEFNQKFDEFMPAKKAYIEKLDKIMHGEDHEIIFGIRPEDIAQCDAKDKGGMKVEIKLSELLGDQYFLHFDFGGKDVLSKVLTEELLEAGQQINLLINESKIHLFDVDSEVRI